MRSSHRRRKYGPGFCYDPHNDSIDIPFRLGTLLILSTDPALPREIRLGHLDPDAALEKLTRILKDHMRRMSRRPTGNSDLFAVQEKALRARPSASRPSDLSSSTEATTG
jgi:hypothetical protein